MASPSVDRPVMQRLTHWLLFSLLVLTPSAPVVHAQNERLVLAFYYAWFDKNTWTSGQLADQPVQPYDSRDRATIQRHVSQAKSAGIDAFVQSWYGPSGGTNNMTESNFVTLLDVSAQQGFRAAVDFEVTGPFFGTVGDMQSALVTLLSGHAKHPAYLKVNGKPVVFFWRQQRFGVDAWAAIRKQVDPDHSSIWIAEGTDPSYLRVFDGIHWYSVAWSAEPVTSLMDYAAKVRKTAQDLGGFRYWVSPVMPGYDDTRLRGAQAGGFVRPRANGDYYRATFAGAAQSGADWVVVTSFNEWLEGSQIEPSAAYGDAYLNLTSELAAAYRAGAVAAPMAASVAPATTSEPAAAVMAQAAAVPTTAPTAKPLPSATATLSPTDTSTPMLTPTATMLASATPLPTVLPTRQPTDTPAPTETPVASGNLESVSTAGWVVIGVVALSAGAGLGGAMGTSSQASVTFEPDGCNILTFDR